MSSTTKHMSAVFTLPFHVSHEGKRYVCTYRDNGNNNLDLKIYGKGITQHVISESNYREAAKQIAMDIIKHENQQGSRTV